VSDQNSPDVPVTPGKSHMPGQSDGLKYEAHVLVEKWTPEQVDLAKQRSGKQHPTRDDFIKHGIAPNDTTNDVEGA
jgi:hypothetical protein